MEQMTPFINYAKHVSAHGYKLVCLHHAGAGASAYLKWQNVFGDRLEVLPVQLPGHETRMREQPFSSCTEATDAVVQALQPYLETGRFSIFGHSMGGILAYEAAKKWIRMGLRPDVCFISSTYVEDMTNVPFSIDLDDAAFLERVRQYGGVEEAGIVLDTPGLRETFLRILRSDFNLSESYVHDGKKLDCPIVCFYGDQDPMVRYEDLLSWKDYTSYETPPIYCYHGGHFFLDAHLQEIADVIQTNIQKYKD